MSKYNKVKEFSSASSKEHGYRGMDSGMRYGILKTLAYGCSMDKKVCMYFVSAYIYGLVYLLFIYVTGVQCTHSHGLNAVNRRALFDNGSRPKANLGLKSS